ncbi:MAG: hypothetical protein MJ162_03355 [Treponema sp.]|nr:hypothetical protein [Treponema sp.]
MKKLLCIFAVVAALSTCVFAQDKVRIDLVAGDSISTNLYTTSNTTNLGVRIGLADNKVGILAGGMLREAFSTYDFIGAPGFTTDFYFNANPYVGIELWNFEILGGVCFLSENEVTPYGSICYNFDLIKPEGGFDDRLSLKVGLEYYVDQFQGKYGPYKDSEYPGLNNLGVDIISIFIPKVSVGLQYNIGIGF